MYSRRIGRIEMRPDMPLSLGFTAVSSGYETCAPDAISYDSFTKIATYMPRAICALERMNCSAWMPACTLMVTFLVVVVVLAAGAGEAGAGLLDADNDGALKPSGTATPLGTTITCSPFVAMNLTGVVSVPPSPPTVNLPPVAK